MNRPALLSVSAACLIQIALTGCGQKAAPQAVAPAVEAPPAAATAESESAAINGQPNPDAALAQQLRYQKELVADPVLRAKQKALCHDQEANALNLAQVLQRPCRALADAEFELITAPHDGVKNTNSL